jgi:hypothetical protein
MNAGAASPWDFPLTGACACWLSCCSAIRLPACSPRASLAWVLGDSGGLCGPPWVKEWGHGGVWVFGPHTPRTAGGGPTSEGGPLRVIKSFFDFMRFFVLYHLQRVGPHNHGPLKTMCHRLMKTPLQVRDPIENKRTPGSGTPLVPDGSEPVNLGTSGSGLVPGPIHSDGRMPLQSSGMAQCGTTLAKAVSNVGTFPLRPFSFTTLQSALPQRCVILINSVQFSSDCIHTTWTIVGP